MTEQEIIDSLVEMDDNGLRIGSIYAEKKKLWNGRIVTPYEMILDGDRDSMENMVVKFADLSLTYSIHQVLCHQDNLIEIFMHKCNDHTTNLTVEVIEFILALKPTPLTRVT